MVKKVRFVGNSNVVKPGRSLTYLPERTGVDFGSEQILKCASVYRRERKRFLRKDAEAQGRREETC